MRVSCRVSGSPVSSRSISVAPLPSPRGGAAGATPAFARGAPSQDIAQARQLGQQAQAAYDAGNYAESEKLWTAAAKLYAQAPTLTLGLARTQAKLGHVVAAQESYNKIIREWGNNAARRPRSRTPSRPRAGGGRGLREGGERHRQHRGSHEPAGHHRRAGRPVAALGLKRPVDPGTHQVKASADGYKPADTTFQVAEAETPPRRSRWRRPRGAAVAGPGPTPGPGQGSGPSPTEPGADTSGSKGGMNKTLAIVAFGVGGAGLVVGAITGVIALGKAGDLKDKCDANKNCPTTAQSDVDSYKSVGTISTIGFIVGGRRRRGRRRPLAHRSEGERCFGRKLARDGSLKKSEGASVSAYFGGNVRGLRRADFGSGRGPQLGRPRPSAAESHMLVRAGWAISHERGDRVFRRVRADRPLVSSMPRSMSSSKARRSPA